MRDVWWYPESRFPSSWLRSLTMDELQNTVCWESALAIYSSSETCETVYPHLTGKHTSKWLFRGPIMSQQQNKD